MSIRILKCSAFALLGFTTGPASANEFEGSLRSLASNELVSLTTAAEVIEAVRAQNAKNGQLDAAAIDSLDAAWRAEVGASARPMIDEVLAQPGSEWLRTQADGLAGLVTEVFVTDQLGLNVIQSNVTSDYWQGDEDKWQQSFGKPDGTIHFGEVELDESTQTYQSQISMPINDPDSGAPLGAITVGINLELLQ
ncbi:MAG: PDC sensor domain-containing protein [Pseudomonadota bacterium]